MNKQELIEELKAVESAHDGIYEHPATVAIRAINQCFEDIEILKAAHGVTADRLDSDAVALLVAANPYNPQW